MSGYQTYVMGCDAIYNLDLLRTLDMFGAILRRERYLASWRILHVDGFEDKPRLPEWTGKPIQFFTSVDPGCDTLRVEARYE